MRLLMISALAVGYTGVASAQAEPVQPAPAEPSAEEQEARELREQLAAPEITSDETYRIGKRFFELALYEDSEVAWLRSLELGYDPKVAVGIAESRERLGKLGGAIEMLERYLASTPEAPDRAAIEARIAELHKAREAAAAAVAEEPVVEEEPEPPPPAPARRNVKPAIWTLTGVSAASLVTGTVLGILALAEQDDYRNNPTKDKADRGERLAIFADVTFGVAVVTGITALVLHLVSRDRKKDSRDEAKLELSPELGKTHSGLSARLRF